MDNFIRLSHPQSVEAREKKQVFKMFAQGMLDRMIVGELRYGSAKASQLYLTRLHKELNAYKSTGNCEHLFNIANYCILEWMAPEHPKHHFNPHVESVTRERSKKKKV